MNDIRQDITRVVLLVSSLIVFGFLLIFLHNRSEENIKHQYVDCPEKTFEKRETFMLECVKHSSPYECTSAATTLYCNRVNQ